MVGANLTTVYNATAADTDTSNDTFALRPLIVSAGPDKEYELSVVVQDSSGNDFQYSTTSPQNDPFHIPTSGSSAGTPGDLDGDGVDGWRDNITNHFEAP